jgi:hypothetical protein
LGVDTTGREEDIRKGAEGRMWQKYYVLMYENGKMRPAEAIPGMGGGGDKGE